MKIGINGFGRIGRSVFRILEGVEGIGVTRFSVADVVRHPIVGRIVEAYEGEGA